MSLKARSLCFSISIFIAVVQSQNVDERYNRNFGPRPANEPLESSNFQSDPVLRELFTEFLSQYHQQLVAQQKSETGTTTTTTTTPFLFRLPTAPTIEHVPVQPHRPIISNAHPAPEVTQTSPRRRVAPRRKSNNPESTKINLEHVSVTTPFSSLLTRSHFPHHEACGESTTAFSSLRVKYFEVAPSPTKEPAPKVHHRISPALENMPARQIVKPEPIVFSEPTRSVPKSQTSQSLLNRLSPKVASTVSPKNEVQQVERKFDEDEFRRQAESAKYQFASDIDDEINGNLHQREEVRDGLAVKGKYSYSDGYYKRTVHYEADDKGYRVVKEQVEPLKGPQTNPDGHAKVSSYIDGNWVNYQITSDDILKGHQKIEI